VGVGAETLVRSLNRHHAQLRLHAHPYRVLQADWDNIGPDGFEFVVLGSSRTLYA